MNREDLYEQLREQIPHLKRHECTPRIMAATNILLYQLIEIQHDEAMDLLLDEQEVGYGL